MKKISRSTKEINTTQQPNICYTSGNCVTCRYFDSNYHNGYCDKHRCDTTPGSSCSDYWAR